MTNPNDPAFQIFEYASGIKTYGLTKREYFAAMALLQEFADARVCKPKELAKLAVETADALIAELSKESK